MANFSTHGSSIDAKGAFCQGAAVTGTNIIISDCSIHASYFTASSRQNGDCSLENKFVVLFIKIFGTLLFPIVLTTLLIW